MGIGASLFLIAVGAILAFAVDYTIAGLDIQVIGWILMIIGVIGFVLTFLLWNRRRSVVGRPAGRVVERDVYEDEPPPL